MRGRLFYVVFSPIKVFFINNINLFLYGLWILIFSLMLALRIALIFSYAPDISVGEDNNVWNVQKVLTGKPLYTNPEDPPFEVFQYSPLSQYPVIWTARVLNFKPGIDVKKIFVTGRILSLLYILLCSGLIFFALKRWFNVSGFLACMASVLSFTGLTQLSFTLRPDALLSLTFIAAMLFFMKFLKDKQNSSLIIATIFAVLAIFSKQNGIQLPVVFLTFSVIFCNLRTTVKVTIYYLFFFIALFSLFYSIYGQQFLIATIGGINNPIDIIYGYQVWDNFFFKYMPFVVLFIFISLIFLQQNKSMVQKFTAVSIMGTFLFALITLMKDGSWINYFSEFFIIGNIAAAYYLDEHVKSNIRTVKILKSGIFIFVTFWGLNTFAHQYFHRHSIHLSAQPKEEYLREKQVADFLSGQAIPERTFVFTPLKHLKNLIPQYSILPNTEYYGVSRLSFKKVRDFSVNGKLSYIVVESSDFPGYRTLIQMDIVTDNYVLLKKINGISIYKYERLF